MELKRLCSCRSGSEPLNLQLHSRGSPTHPTSHKISTSPPQVSAVVHVCMVSVPGFLHLTGRLLPCNLDSPGKPSPSLTSAVTSQPQSHQQIVLDWVRVGECRWDWVCTAFTRSVVSSGVIQSDHPFLGRWRAYFQRLLLFFSIPTSLQSPHPTQLNPKKPNKSLKSFPVSSRAIPSLQIAG